EQSEQLVGPTIDLVEIVVGELAPLLLDLALHLAPLPLQYVLVHSALLNGVSKASARLLRRLGKVQGVCPTSPGPTMSPISRGHAHFRKMIEGRERGAKTRDAQLVAFTQEELLDSNFVPRLDHERSSAHSVTSRLGLISSVGSH